MGISTSERNGSARISVSGSFGFEDHKPFRDAYKTSLANGAKEIQIDFAQATGLDSAALGMLLIVKEAAESVGSKVSLMNCSGMVAQVIAVANFNQLFEIN